MVGPGAYAVRCRTRTFWLTDVSRMGWFYAYSSLEWHLQYAFAGPSWDTSLHLGATTPWCSGPGRARSTTKCTQVIHNNNSHWIKFHSSFSGFRQCVIKTCQSRTSRMSRMGLNKKRYDMHTGHSQWKWEFNSFLFEPHQVESMRDRD